MNVEITELESDITLAINHIDQYQHPVEPKLE